MGRPESNKKYYEKNKEKILALQHTYKVCECGLMVRVCARSNHLKSNRHKKLLAHKQETTDFKEKWGSFIEKLIDYGVLNEELNIM